jgi:hypothetical protein
MQKQAAMRSQQLNLDASTLPGYDALPHLMPGGYIVGS